MSKKVTYNEIIEALARKTGFSKQKSEAFTKALIQQVKKELEENGKASITNFGSFQVKEVAERQGQNPQTGEPITIPAHKRVSFTPYKALREEVNKKYAHLEPELIVEEKEQTKNNQAEKQEEEKPVLESQVEVRTAKGKQKGLLMLIAVLLLIVTLASVWFLLRTDEEQLATDQAIVEEPQTPEAATTIIEDMEANAVAADTSEEEEEPEPEPEQEPVSQTEGRVNTETVQQTETATIATGTTYEVQKDEWYWVIAKKAYGKSKYWPLIFQRNESAEQDPDKLNSNRKLEIPKMEGTAENPAKADYRNLVTASRMVSKAYLKYDKMEKAKEYEIYAQKWEEKSRE